MNYLFLFFSAASSAVITVAGKLFNNRTSSLVHVSRLYNFLYALFASLGWLVAWLCSFSFELRVLPYSFVYGLGYLAFTVGLLGAIKTGLTSLTALIKQMSLVGVSFWGFLFWNTKVTTLSILGILLVFVSLFLCLIKKEEKAQQAITFKWLFNALMVGAGNACCSITQRYQQMAFDYRHKNMFMFFGVFFAMLLCLGLALREHKGCWKAATKKAWCFPAMAGICSVLSNTFILLMIKAQLSSSIIYPTVAVGGLILTIFISLISFKERLRPLQWCGIVIGSVALVLLNLS